MMSEIPSGFDKIKKAKMRDAELVRLGLIAELDAINLYEQLAARTNNKLIKKVFLDIANEEKEHVGEFLELLKQLDKEQIKAIKDGKKEVERMK